MKTSDRLVLLYLISDNIDYLVINDLILNNVIIQLIYYVISIRNNTLYTVYYITKIL